MPTLPTTSPARSWEARRSLSANPARDLGTSARTCTGLLILGGLVLVSVVAYALMLDGHRTPALSGTSAHVVVFYPDTNSWRTFRRGVQACSERGILSVVDEGGDWVRVRPALGGREIRFSWDGALGERELRLRLNHHLRSAHPPVAVLGSVNTTLTLVLARELAAWSRTHRAPAPPLLVTGATAVEVERSPASSPSIEPIPESRTLLEIYPGRTFRFCLNNRRLAALVVDFLAHQRLETPSASFIVLDRFDPFSEDLAAFFDQELHTRFPNVPVLLREPADKPGSPDDRALAREIWSQVEQTDSSGDPRPVWVMLTTQGDPAQRFLDALQATGPSSPSPSLRLLCGDGIGRSTLSALARSLPCPAVSSASSSPRVAGVPVLEAVAQGQIEAEAVSALVLCSRHDPSDLVPALARISIPAQAREAVGRSLAFQGGERAGEDLGHVLEVQPGDGHLKAHAPRADQTWTSLRWERERWVPVAEAPRR